MGIIRRLLFVFLFVQLSLICTGCHWQLRNPSEVPPQLKVLSVDTDNVESRFRVDLLNLLESMKIQLVPPPQTAPLTLRAYHYSFTHNNPPVSTTNVAINYTYTLKVTVEIDDGKGHTVLPPYLIVVSRDISVNVNQIFTINSVSLFQEELQRDAINLIYYWMTSEKARQLLTGAQKKPGAHSNAASSKTT